MAILVNMGQRGFVLKEGFLNPGQTITVDQETAEKLSRVYPKELKVIIPEMPKASPVLPTVKEEAKVMPSEDQCEGLMPVKDEPIVEPKKRGRKPKAK